MVRSRASAAWRPSRVRPHRRNPHLHGGKLREPVAILIFATTLLVSCATSPEGYYAAQPRCGTGQPDPVVAQRCLAVPQAREYLGRAQKQVLDAWQVPRNVSANESIDLTFRLRLDGSIRCLSLSPNPNEALAQSVVSAVQHVTPFPPVPSEAACLGKLPVVATFSNPLEKK
jgi:hypothetical protein